MPPIRMVHCGTLLSSSHALVFKGAVCSEGVAHTNQWRLFSQSGKLGIFGTIRHHFARMITYHIPIG